MGSSAKVSPRVLVAAMAWMGSSILALSLHPQYLCQLVSVALRHLGQSWRVGISGRTLVLVQAVPIKAPLRAEASFQ